MRNTIRTIEDLEAATYGPARKDITKADDPVLTTTTATYLATYGAFAWSQLNHEANAFGCLPKYPWTRSGWRVKTVRRSTGIVGGVAENAALPDTAKPTWATVSTKPKTVAHNFNISEVHQFLASQATDDDNFADIEYLRQDQAYEHKEQINKMLLQTNDTLASYSFESIDRVCGSYSEIAGCGQTTGDLDIYSLDRDTAASWADAYVDHNSDTNRTLTDLLIRNLVSGVAANGGNTTFFLTGHDTYSLIQGLFDTKVYYDVLGKSTATVGVNGIQTKDGLGYGTNVATLYGLPLIISKDVVDDGSSRIYALDTSDPEGFGSPRLGLKIAKPTQYFEAGMSSGDPFGINALADEGMYRTMGELICKFFAGQGKIRDLT